MLLLIQGSVADGVKNWIPNSEVSRSNSLIGLQYRIASNKRRGRSFNFWHFLGGVYSREVFTRGRRLLKNTEKLQFYISTSMISSSSSIRKTTLSASSTSGICSSNTSSCDINSSLPFWQGSPSLKQWIKPSSEPLVLSLKPHHLNELESGGGGVYLKGAFIK